MPQQELCQLVWHAAEMEIMARVPACSILCPLG